MWYVRDVLYAVLYVRVSCFVVRGCGVSRRYIDVCYCDMFSVVNVYLDHLKFYVRVQINKINKRNTMYYGTSSLEWVVEFKYLGIIIARNNTFGRALEHLCQQSKRAQAVLDLHIHRHPTLSVDHIMRLFDILIRPILTFDCEI